MNPSEFERAWLAAARRGDQDAFEALVRAYEKRVFALTLRMCRDPEDAAEAAQEAFLAAWQGLPQFRGDASFSTWLYRLASNACVDILRKNKRQAQPGLSLDDEALGLDLPDGAPLPEQTLERAELRAEIEAGLQALSPEHRAVLILREIHQLSYEEIAQTLAVDLGTVKSRINRGRKQLRNFLVQRGNFFAPTPSKEAEKEGCT